MDRGRCCLVPSSWVAWRNSLCPDLCGSDGNARPTNALQPRRRISLWCGLGIATGVDCEHHSRYRWISACTLLRARLCYPQIREVCQIRKPGPGHRKEWIQTGTADAPPAGLRPVRISQHWPGAHTRERDRLHARHFAGNPSWNDPVCLCWLSRAGHFFLCLRCIAVRKYCSALVLLDGITGRDSVVHSPGTHRPPKPRCGTKTASRSCRGSGVASYFLRLRYRFRHCQNRYFRLSFALVADPSISDDGLFTPEVGSWSEDKYKLVGLYSRLFATGMKFKWEQRVYIDLYAGAGIAKLRGTEKRVMGSPLIALTVRDPFDLYIFCEENDVNLEALKQRVKRIAPERKVEYVPGDCNAKVNRICSLIPVATPTEKVLSFCFVDPYDIGTKFSTIKMLSKRFIDFLVLLALYMDANRNYGNYLRSENRKVDDFLGLADWRDRWEKEKYSTIKFPEFLAKEYANQMSGLGYINQPIYNMKKVRSDEKNLPLYLLTLFSRHQKAYEFWEEVLKYGTDQQGLF